jgi:glycosyltransferase involved in cell wall biosynthesis
MKALAREALSAVELNGTRPAGIPVRPSAHAHAPKVTFGVPVYNGERFLPDTLDSILAQDGDISFEIVISDNASTDRTYDICKEYAERYSNIRYVRQPMNRGAAANYRAVLEMARGEYFKWNAADDTIAPAFLGTTVPILDGPERPDGVFTLSTYVDETGCALYSAEDVVALAPWPHGRRAQAAHVVDALFKDGKAAMVVTMGIYKTSLLREIRPMGTYQGADWIIALEVALAGDLLYYSERPLAFFRSHPGSSSFKDLTDYRAVQRFFDPSVRSSVLIMFQRKRRFLEMMRSALLRRNFRAGFTLAPRVLSLSLARGARRGVEALRRGGQPA